MNIELFYTLWPHFLFLNGPKRNQNHKLFCLNSYVQWNDSWRNSVLFYILIWLLEMVIGEQTWKILWYVYKIYFLVRLLIIHHQTKPEEQVRLIFMNLADILRIMVTLYLDSSAHWNSNKFYFRFTLLHTTKHNKHENADRKKSGNNNDVKQIVVHRFCFILCSFVSVFSIYFNNNNINKEQQTHTVYMAAQ